MNGLWAGMMLAAVVYGAFYGTLPDITQAALDSAKEAVTLSMTMLGILAFWMGLMQIGTASGLVERLTKGVEPLLRRLFPRIPGRSSCHGADRPELHCQYALTWLGCHSGGNEGNGGIVETGEDSQRTGGGNPGRDCQ